MAGRESALRALHLQVDFEVTAKAGELSAARSATLLAQRNADDALAQKAAALAEWRRLHAQAAINTALTVSLRGAYRQAVVREKDLAAQHERTRIAEGVLRDELAALRHRARHLQRALDEVAAERASDRAVRDGLVLDDLWLATRSGALR